MLSRETTFCTMTGSSVMILSTWRLHRLRTSDTLFTVQANIYLPCWWAALTTWLVTNTLFRLNASAYCRE